MYINTVGLTFRRLEKLFKNGLGSDLDFFKMKGRLLIGRI